MTYINRNDISFYSEMMCDSIVTVRFSLTDDGYKHCNIDEKLK